jgi:glycosyltransferase involved in cell wall biosynthesis
MLPLVSIVITVYNRQNYLPKAIESILTQSYSNFELLIWDDGSTDKSLTIAHHYAQQDDRIRVLAAPHQGRGISIASACAEAKGKYLGLVDSDDLLGQTAIEETVQILETQPKIGMVYTDYILIDKNAKYLGVGETCKIPYDREKLLTTFMVFHFRLKRRSVYESVGGFDPDFKYAQDYDLCLKISEVAEIYHLSEVRYYYRQHEDAISTENRIDQLLHSKRAIQNAMTRRGMDDQYGLEFKFFANCTIYKK